MNDDLIGQLLIDSNFELFDFDCDDVDDSDIDPDFTIAIMVMIVTLPIYQVILLLQY